MCEAYSTCLAEHDLPYAPDYSDYCECEVQENHYHFAAYYCECCFFAFDQSYPEHYKWWNRYAEFCVGHGWEPPCDI